MRSRRQAATTSRSKKFSDVEKEAVELVEQRVAQAATYGARPATDAKIELDAGDTVDATVGKETFYPIKFNGFDVGPVRVTTKVREGETGDDAFLRARGSAEAMFLAEFDLKLRDYFKRLERVGDETENRRRR